MKQFKLFINNEWVDAEGGKTFTSTNPCTGEVIAEMAYASVEDTRKAIAAAKAALPAWAALDVESRAKYLHRVADILEADWKNLHGGKQWTLASRSVRPVRLIFRWQSVRSISMRTI